MVGERYNAHLRCVSSALILWGEGNHAANNPDHPVGAFPFWCVAQLAVQCKLGILSEWRIRLSLDHRHHLDRFG